MVEHCGPVCHWNGAATWTPAEASRRISRCAQSGSCDPPNFTSCAASAPRAEISIGEVNGGRCCNVARTLRRHCVQARHDPCIGRERAPLRTFAFFGTFASFLAYRLPLTADRLPLTAYRSPSSHTAYRFSARLRSSAPPRPASALVHLRIFISASPQLRIPSARASCPRFLASFRATSARFL